MDLHWTNAVATPAEKAAVDALLGAEASVDDRDRAPAGRNGLSQPPAEPLSHRRDLLLPALLAVQSRIGWVSKGALNQICQRLHVPPAEAYGVASFYALIELEPAPRVLVHVCDDIACLARGAGELCEELGRRDEGARRASRGAAAGAGDRRRSPCLGLCDLAPAALVLAAGDAPSEHVIASATPDAVGAAIEGRTLVEPLPIKLPQAGEPGLVLLRRVGGVDPESLDDYRAHGGYSALRQAFKIGPEGVIREIVESKLLGRGGAAFPAGKKWEAVARATVRPHYLVCNADESEPGTFKDRVLMEQDPFAIIEAMTIAGFATGCEEAYIYIRGEYRLAARRISAAIAQARARGLLGDDVFGHGVRFDIEVRSGAGAYICGEETALLNSIEGYRGEPRNKPPYPVQAGLFGKPTLINNVETLANVLEIVSNGGSAFASIGTSGSTGTKLFCLSGHVGRPGVYEVPFGATLGELITLAGGVHHSRKAQAVLLGGAAGTFVTPDRFDVPLTFEGVRTINAAIGSGVVLVFDDQQDMTPILLRIAAFFRDESCGQCVPCRVGTVRQEELIHRLAVARPLGSYDQERALFHEIRDAMMDASICGLGQTAATALDSALVELKAFKPGTREQTRG